MKPFKVENYEREQGKGKFPAFIQLDTSACEAMRRSLARALGMDPLSDGLKLVLEIMKRSKPVDGVSAESEIFDLRELLCHLGLACTDRVFLNWYRFDQVDDMRTVDVAAHFSDIWYPASDDLDIIDERMTWILSISHEGDVSILRLCCRIPLVDS